MSKKVFWDHIDDLRHVIMRVFVVWVILTVAYFILMPYIFNEVILAPTRNDFIFYELLRSIGESLSLEGDFFAEEFNVKLINISLAAPFFIHISTSFYLSVVTTVPYLFYEAWRFLAPALYEHEQRGVSKALVMGTVMFFVGLSVGYFMVYPLALRFLASYQLSTLIENTISLSSYIDNFMMLILMMGLAFEIPLVMWLLSLLGLVDREMLSRYRRHAVVVVVILAAVITPTGDPFTLAVVALPLYILYEVSLFMVKRKEVS